MAQGWIEVSVDAPSGWGELVAGVLAEEVGGSVELAPAGEGRERLRASYAADADGPERRSALAGRLAGLAAVAPELATLAPRYRPVPAEDFAHAWRAIWRPFRVGRICVVPPDDDRELRPGDVALRLEPGGVFGTGRHATTRTCLRLLQGLVRPDERVLDVGSGSGILAVAAALLGAAEARGVDADEHARPAAETLARDNGVADRCAFRTADAGEVGLRRVDGLVANLYAEVLQRHAADLAAALRPGGWCLFSGIELSRLVATRAALAGAGLDLAEERIVGRWATLRGVSAPGRRAVSRGRT